MPSSPRVLFAPIEVAGAGDNQIVPANPKNKIKVISFFIVAAGAVAIRFRSAANPLTGPMTFAANGGLAIPAGDMFSHLLETNVNEALNINLGTAVAVAGGLAYKLEP